MFLQIIHILSQWKREQKNRWMGSCCCWGKGEWEDRLTPSTCLLFPTTGSKHIKEKASSFPAEKYVLENSCARFKGDSNVLLLHTWHQNMQHKKTTWVRKLLIFFVIAKSNWTVLSGAHELLLTEKTTLI